MNWHLHHTPSSLKVQPKRSLFRGSRWVFALLTAVYFFWIGMRAVSQPNWLSLLPPLLLELVHLMEIGWLATLGVLWSLVWWQGRQEYGRPLQPLSLEELYNLHPAEFEHYVARLFRQKGYKVSLRGRSGDLGVDLVLQKRGGRLAIVQCKRYRNTIGPEFVRELYGTLIHEGVAHAFLVTTADISASARTWAQGKPMTLIDGETLVTIGYVLQPQPVSSKPAPSTTTT